MGVRTWGAGAGIERNKNSAGRSWNLEKDIRNSERGERMCWRRIRKPNSQGSRENLGLGRLTSEAPSNCEFLGS